MFLEVPRMSDDVRNVRSYFYTLFICNLIFLCSCYGCYPFLIFSSLLWCCIVLSTADSRPRCPGSGSVPDVRAAEDCLTNASRSQQWHCKLYWHRILNIWIMIYIEAGLSHRIRGHSLRDTFCVTQSWPVTVTLVTSHTLDWWQTSHQQNENQEERRRGGEIHLRFAAYGPQWFSQNHRNSEKSWQI